MNHHVTNHLQVSKDAVWFSSVDAEDGHHVLMVTDDAKKAKKYGLPALQGQAWSVTLPGKVGVAVLGAGAVHRGKLCCLMTIQSWRSQCV
jgi:hypothetical protein